MTEAKLERTLTSEAPKRVGETATFKGWVNTVRRHGKAVFIDLRDRSGLLQTVAFGEGAEGLQTIKPEFVVEMSGAVKARPDGMSNPDLVSGAVELEIDTVSILAESEPLPIDISKDSLNVTLPVLLDNRPITLRHPEIKGIFKVQETIMQSFRQTLDQLDFTEFQAPTIVPVATEGGAEVFPIEYYDYTAYLGQSPQLYKQIMVSVFERVYTVAKAYRAEPSVTTRHIAEYISLDAEFGFIDSWKEIMDVAEQAIKDIVVNVQKKNPDVLVKYLQEPPHVPNQFPRIKMRDAQQIIFDRTGRDNRKEPDLSPEDEKEISAWAKEKHDSDFVFITHYPTSKRPFYTQPDPEDPEYTLSFDLLGRGMELITGGQRINDYQQLLNNINKWGLDPAKFETYLQAFRYGMPPEGGFALGTERMTMQLLGLGNIREASLFPRDMQRIDIRLNKEE